jgi:hypothetical protein
MSKPFDFRDDEETPVHGSTYVAVLDADAKPLDNYRAMVAFIQRMPVADKVEMLKTFAAFCRAELNG